MIYDKYYFQSTRYYHQEICYVPSPYLYPLVLNGSLEFDNGYKSYSETKPLLLVLSKRKSFLVIFRDAMVVRNHSYIGFWFALYLILLELIDSVIQFKFLKLFVKRHNTTDPNFSRQDKIRRSGAARSIPYSYGKSLYS